MPAPPLPAAPPLSPLPPPPVVVPAAPPLPPGALPACPPVAPPAPPPVPPVAPLPPPLGRVPPAPPALVGAVPPVPLTPGSVPTGFGAVVVPGPGGVVSAVAGFTGRVGAEDSSALGALCVGAVSVAVTADSSDCGVASLLHAPITAPSAPQTKKGRQNISAGLLAFSRGKSIQGWRQSATARTAETPQRATFSHPSEVGSLERPANVGAAAHFPTPHSGSKSSIASYQTPAMYA